MGRLASFQESGCSSGKIQPNTASEPDAGVMVSSTASEGAVPGRGMADDAVAGRRILIVEDNFMVAMSLERTLRQWGCDVVGPYPSLEEGRRAALDPSIEAAVLDINIVGGS